MLTVINVFLLFYALPFLISYILLRKECLNRDWPLTFFDVFLVMCPAINIIVAMVFLLVATSRLFESQLWVPIASLFKNENIARAFFRIKK